MSKEFSKKKKKSNIYWGGVVDSYVVDYILEKDIVKKNRIFEAHLYKPINKLIESIVHRYRLYRFFHDGIDDIKQQCIVFVIETVLPKYDVKRQKSYAYVGTSVRRYLWQMIKKHTDKEGKNVSIDMDLNELRGNGEIPKRQDNTVLNSIAHSYRMDEENVAESIIMGFIAELKEDVEMLDPIKERSTANWVEFLNSFILVCETNHGISFIENKVIFYNALKKINNFSTNKNYKYMNILRERYRNFLKEYLNNG